MQFRFTRLAALAGTVLVAASAFAIPAHLGVSYSAWDKDLTDTAPGHPGDLFLQSVDEMVSTGVTWVALNAWEFQDDLDSTTIAPRYYGVDPYPNYSTPDPSLARAVEEFHNHGIKVLLKPMVDVTTGQWRGQIQPSPGWFNAYGDFVGRWAAKAKLWGVDGFSIGCEFRKVIWDTPDAVLRGLVSDLVTAIRNDVGYAGPLTYSANHDSYQDVPFWDLMDYIGIDAYFALTGLRDPSEAQLLSAWEGHADDIEDWWLNDLTEAERKKILFSEIGYTIWDGTNMEPNKWGPTFYDGQGNPIADPGEQAQCYGAALDGTWERGWMDGYFWWIWDTEPGGGGYNPFTPQGFPAQQVLFEHYVPEPASLVLAGAGLVALWRRRRRSPR